MYRQQLRPPNPTNEQARRQFEEKFFRKSCLELDHTRPWDDVFISRSTIEYDEASDDYGWVNCHNFTFVLITEDEPAWLAKQDDVVSP